MNNDNTYNGWKNRATWNVALWLQEDFGSDIPEWTKDRAVKDGDSLRARVEDYIRECRIKAYYLEPIRGCEIMHFLTPDAERFDDADWDEIFAYLIEDERKNTDTDTE